MLISQARIINSDEVQSVVRPIKKDVKRRRIKNNPLKNLYTRFKLNPYAKTARRMPLLAEAERVKAKKEKLDTKRTKLSKEEAAQSKLLVGHGTQLWSRILVIMHS